MALDFTSYEKALLSLAEAVLEYAKQPANRFIRDATIQRFEYSYELSHKMLKRFLEQSEPNTEIIDALSFPELIRTGSEKGLLLNEWKVWKKYRAARNITSHTYDENKAMQVCGVIPQFLKDAEYLLNKLKERNK